MRALFLGNHPAIDFLNTVMVQNGDSVETIGDGKAWLDWLADAGLLDRAQAATLARRFDGKALDDAAAEARKIREWARAWLARWRAAPKRDYREEITILNKLLARAPNIRQLAAARGTVKVVESMRFETADALIAAVAAQVAALVSNEDAGLVRECASSTCTLWFLDRTRSHRRLFCSPAACGNREKVAAFRARQRS